MRAVLVAGSELEARVRTGSVSELSFTTTDGSVGKVGSVVDDIEIGHVVSANVFGTPIPSLEN